MARIRLGIICVVVFAKMGVFAQNFNFGYLVEFADKNNTEFSIDLPEEFLSKRAINRRAKQNIKITEQDFPPNQNYIDSLLSYSAILHVTSRWFNSAVYFTNSNLFESNALQCGFVKSVKLVYLGNTSKSTTINSKWNKDSDTLIFGNSTNQIRMCNAQKLYNRGYNGKGIHIAVLDGGFWRVNEMACFDSLFLNKRILGYWDFVAHDSNVFDDATHGMGVLSIMGGNLPNELMGTAPQASYYLYRTEQVSSEYPIEEENWIAAAESADSAGADIITASLGYSTFDVVEMNYTYADMDGKTTRVTQGAEVAFSKGMVVINSAGNEGANNWHYITAPSDGEHVICVGAVDQFENIAAFSSRGPSYDGRVKPDVVTKGVQTTLINANETVGVGNGTSYSCPVLTGMVASLWQALPNYSNYKILDLTREIGDRYEDPENTYGYGVPDFGKTLFVIDSLVYKPMGGNRLDKIYPIPFDDFIAFHLFIEHEQEIQMVVQDIKGTKIISQKKEVGKSSYNYIELTDLNRFERGYYFLSIYTIEGKISKKIVRY